MGEGRMGEGRMGEGGEGRMGEGRMGEGGEGRGGGESRAWNKRMPATGSPGSSPSQTFWACLFDTHRSLLRKGCKPR